MQDVPDCDVSKLLTTAPLQGPHIVAFVNEAEIQALFVVGDTVLSEVNKKVGILEVLVTLVAIYYIFDLDYPRPYSMLLAMVQAHVIEAHVIQEGLLQEIQVFLKVSCVYIEIPAS